MDVVDLTDDEAPVAWEPLRIGASQVGACVGVHPWAEVDELFEGLVWQGAAGRALLARDAAAFGVVVESREEEAARVLEGASAATRAAFRSAERAARSSATASVKDVSRVKAAARAAVEAAVAQREVTAAEGAALVRYANHTAHTEFGRRHEADAIGAYERATGNAVREGNECRHELRFPRDRARKPRVFKDEGTKGRDALAKAVQAFAASDEEARELPRGASASDRRRAHALAEALGLGHASRGAGADRRLVLSKAPTGWCFLDLERRARGPFDDAAMRRWIREGWFAPQLLVARTFPGAPPCACAGSVYRPLLSVLAGCAAPRCAGRRLAEGSGAAVASLVADYASDDESDDGDDDELFRVVGYVDGIADEVDCRGDEWTTRGVVVEIKNRMASAREPDLYDQLQIVAYLHMTGLDAGHLVQRVRSDPRADVRVDVVALADHEDAWRSTVVPRLYALAAAVLAMREDADARRRWLTDSPKARRRTVADLCDWMPLPPDDA